MLSSHQSLNNITWVLTFRCLSGTQHICLCVCVFLCRYISNSIWEFDFNFEFDRKEEKCVALVLIKVVDFNAHKACCTWIQTPSNAHIHTYCHLIIRTSLTIINNSENTLSHREHDGFGWVMLSQSDVYRKTYEKIMPVSGVTSKKKRRLTWIESYPVQFILLCVCGLACIWIQRRAYVLGYRVFDT